MPAVEIVATVLSDEVHVALEVTLAWLLSEYVPVAVNCCVAPTDSETFSGVTEIDVRVGTVKFTPLLANPETVTTTFPVVAPLGTLVAMLPVPQLVAVAAVPLN
jgi:hypothetical protein